MIAIMLVTGLSVHASDKKPAKKAKAKKEAKADCKDKKCCKPTKDCPVVCIPESCNKDK